MSATVPLERFRQARVARLATISAVDGTPQIVPVTFAVLPGAGEDRIVSMVDHKPKRTLQLARLANITAHPAVSLLVDHYAEDWTALWWARADGRARVVGADLEPQLRSEAVEALAARYPQYRERPPEGALIVIEVERWTGWSAAGQ